MLNVWLGLGVTQGKQIWAVYLKYGLCHDKNLHVFYGGRRQCRMAGMEVSRTRWGNIRKTNSLICFLIQLLVFSWVSKAELQPS